MESPASWLVTAVAVTAVVVPGIVVIGVFILLAIRARRVPAAVQQAYRDISQWAQAVGWTESANSTFHEGLRGGPFSDPDNLLHAGTSPRSAAVAWGRFRGLTAATWDYNERYKNHAEPRRYWHIVAVTLPVALRQIEMRQARTDPRPGMSFEDEEFNSSWRVTAEDHRAAYGIANPQMIARLKRPDMQGKNILIYRDRMVLWRAGVIDPASTEEALQQLAELVDLIPEHVWDDARSQWQTRAEQPSPWHPPPEHD